MVNPNAGQKAAAVNGPAPATRKRPPKKKKDAASPSGSASKKKKGGAAAAPFTAPPKPDGRRWAPGHRERVIHAHQDEGAGAEGGGGKTRAGGGPLLERKKGKGRKTIAGGDIKSAEHITTNSAPRELSFD